MQIYIYIYIIIYIYIYLRWVPPWAHRSQASHRGSQNAQLTFLEATVEVCNSRLRDLAERTGSGPQMTAGGAGGHRGSPKFTPRLQMDPSGKYGMLEYVEIRRPQPDAGGARRRRLLRRQTDRQTDTQTDRRTVWAAGRGPDPHFTAMVLWLCETVMELRRQCRKAGEWKV